MLNYLGLSELEKTPVTHRCPNSTAAPHRVQCLLSPAPFPALFNPGVSDRSGCPVPVQGAGALNSLHFAAALSAEAGCTGQQRVFIPGDAGPEQQQQQGPYEPGAGFYHH